MSENNFVENTQFFSKNLKNPLVKKILAFNETDSTNKKAKELAQKNEPEGTIIIAKIQKQGRGRFNRIWQSPEGGLYFSIILKPKIKTEKSTLLPLVSALSVCKTIESICDLDVKIKWPNDVLINGKKICGILLESDSDRNKINFIILGIGINLNIDTNSLSKDFNATSLSYEFGINLDFYDFFKKLLMNLDKYYKIFNNHDFNQILFEWKKNSDTIGKKIVIKTSNEEIKGKAFDVDENGFLVIQTDSGEYKKITSGDCLYLK